MVKLTDLYHKILKEKEKIDISVDMTCGKGNDTLFLSEISNKVYAIDIQKTAIDLTSQLCKEKDNIVYIHDNHENIDLYVKENIDVAIYNLGYLPGINHDIKTLTQTTINSLKKILSLLSIEGIIIIELYPHNREEIDSVINYTKALDKSYDVINLSLTNKDSSPILVIIKKNKIAT